MYVISGTWGEYDDYTKVPMFACRSVEEARLFCDSLNEKENPLWNKVLEYFGSDSYTPSDIYFIFEEVPLLEL